MSTCLKGAIGLTKKGTSTVWGQPVMEIDDLTGSQFFVQTAAPHRLARAVLSAADLCSTDSNAMGQTIELSGYGAKFDITAPRGYVDLTTLSSAG